MQLDGVIEGLGIDRRALSELAVDEANSAIYVTDASANIVFINRTFTEILGWEPHEVYGRRPRDVFGSPRYVEADYKKLWSELSVGRTVREEIRTLDRHGKELWLTMVLRPVLAEDGKFSHLIGFLENTTESRHIQSLQRDVLEAVAQEMPLTGVMTLICERVEKMFPEIVCSVLAVDADKKLRPLAAPSMPDYYGKAIDGIAAAPVAGSCGTCAWRGEAVFLSAVLTVTRIGTGTGSVSSMARPSASRRGAASGASCSSAASAFCQASSSAARRY